MGGKTHWTGACCKIQETRCTHANPQSRAGGREDRHYYPVTRYWPRVQRIFASLGIESLRRRARPPSPVGSRFPNSRATRVEVRVATSEKTRPHHDTTVYRLPLSVSASPFFPPPRPTPHTTSTVLARHPPAQPPPRVFPYAQNYSGVPRTEAILRHPPEIPGLSLRYPVPA